MCLLGAVALSSLVFTADPKGVIDITSLQVIPGASRRYKNKQQDFAFVGFNVTADLSPLFNWNTKQLFVYLEAEYTNKQGVRSDVVIWDRIIRRKEDANVVVSGRNKYIFREVSTSFKDVSPAHYSLKYNVMPYVGMLTYGEAARTTEPLSFPESSQSI